MLGQSRNVKRAGAGLNVKCNQPHQSYQCADTEVEGDLEGGVVLLLAAAPDADHDESGYQCQLVEEVEEEQVERSEGPEDSARHDEEQYVELLLALLDFPGNTGRREGDDGTHQYQADVDAVHADVVTDAESGYPGKELLELVALSAGLELQEHLQRQQRRNKCGQDGDAANHRPEGARHQQQEERCAQRPADDVGKRRHVYFSARYRTSATPSAKRNA